MECASSARVRVCTWTWMWAVGNVHPNKTGYGVIAEAFKTALS